MDVTQTRSPSPTTAAPAAATGNATLISSDFQTFLKMMTTQLQNQDPMNPMDSADYAVQLATFSGVEQQARTNQLLETMRGEFGLMGMAQLAGWVGREARSTAPVWVDGAPVALSPEPAQGADRAVLVVTDSQGRLVTRQNIPVDDGELTWDPVDMQGYPLSAGTYRFTLESYAGEEQLATSDVASYARITEVRGGATGTSLILAGGVEVPASAVTALRD